MFMTEATHTPRNSYLGAAPKAPPNVAPRPHASSDLRLPMPVKVIAGCGKSRQAGQRRAKSRPLACQTVVSSKVERISSVI
jgi:hypothetical protein